MPIRPLRVVCLLITTMMSVAAATPASAPTPLPPESISDDTVAMIYIDVTRWERAEVFAMSNTLVDTMPRELQEAARGDIDEPEWNEDFDRLEAARADFIAGGGRSILIGFVAGEEVGDEFKPYVMFRVEPGTGPEAMQAAVPPLLRAAEQGVREDFDRLTFERLDVGWIGITQDPAGELATPFGRGSAEATARFERLLNATAYTGEAATAVVVNGEPVRQRLASWQRLLREPADEDPAHRNTIIPMPALRQAAAELLAAVESSETASAHLVLGESPVVAVWLDFPDAAAADRARGAHNTLLDRADASLGEQLRAWQAVVREAGEAGEVGEVEEREFEITPAGLSEVIATLRSPEPGADAGAGEAERMWFVIEPEAYGGAWKFFAAGLTAAYAGAELER